MQKRDTIGMIGVPKLGGITGLVVFGATLRWATIFTVPGYVLLVLVEAAFVALARGDVVMPPVMSMDLAAAHGEVDVKTAYIPGFDGFAIKVSPGFFDNPKLGLP